MALGRKSRLSYLSQYKTHQKVCIRNKNAVLTIFKNPFFVPEIIQCFKICKLAKR